MVSRPAARVARLALCSAAVLLAACAGDASLGVAPAGTRASDTPAVPATPPAA
ncbi:MAG: hypothetical protein JWL60_647, partial [Gemmatimonadetes bacterium]|nr:hypothetical protein [Gemmatimonadota bacterium]